MGEIAIGSSRWKCMTEDGVWVGGKGGVRRPPACPIGPFHPAAAWRLRRWTWACSRSSGWATAAASSAALSSSPLPPSPSATAPPSCPSPPQKSCCHWACRKTGERRGQSQTVLKEDILICESTAWSKTVSFSSI